MKRLVSGLEPLAVLAALGGLWWVASHGGWLSPVFVPTPEAMLASLHAGLLQGDLATAAAATVQRMLLGWGLACLLGVVLGALIGVSPTARAWIQPTLEFVRPLPASAVLPLAISVFGLSPAMVLSVVAFGAMWPVLLSTVQGFASLHVRLTEVAAALGVAEAALSPAAGALSSAGEPQAARPSARDRATTDLAGIRIYLSYRQSTAPPPRRQPAESLQLDRQRGRTEVPLLQQPLQ